MAEHNPASAPAHYTRAAPLTPSTDPARSPSTRPPPSSSKTLKRRREPLLIQRYEHNIYSRLANLTVAVLEERIASSKAVSVR